VTGAAKKGDQYGVTCTYDNTTSDTVSFGESSTDEMCFGVLYFWPNPVATISTYCL
jgi:Copper type II ascorbate-dependent monooxygenase, C-terminal domain